MKYKFLIGQEAQIHSIDWVLLAAIVQVESAENPKAMRYEEKYPYLVDPPKYAKLLNISEATETALQRFSFGLCQIMGANLREMGFKKELTNALEPEINLCYGAMTLERLMTRYKGDMPTAVSAYNAGTPHVENGVFRNQTYVTNVLGHYAAIHAVGV